MGSEKDDGHIEDDQLGRQVSHPPKKISQPTGICPYSGNVLDDSTPLGARISLLHPYTTYAAAVMNLPVERIDYLFKGR
jgi:hypothetical protein